MAKEPLPANAAEIERQRREAKYRNGRGRFKAGVLRGRAARRYKALGAITTRIDASGRRRCWIKVACGRNGRRNWMPLARYVWSKAQGPVPGGMMVVHLNGNVLDDRLANLVLCIRRQLLRMNRDRDHQWEARRKEAARQEQQRAVRDRRGVRRRKVEIDRQRRRKRRRRAGVRTPSPPGRR